MPGLIRARHPQMLLALVAEEQPAVHARLVPSLSGGAKLTQALPIEWIPVEIDIELVETLARMVKPSLLSALIGERQRREMGSALFRTFVATAQKLFGLSPATIVRHLGRGWRQIFSDCGEIEVVSLGDHEGVVALRGLPPSCLASAVWLNAIPDGMRVLFELVNAAGDVVVARRGDEVELRFRW